MHWRSAAAHLVLVGVAPCCNAPAMQPGQLEAPPESVKFCIGRQLGKTLKDGLVEALVDAVGLRVTCLGSRMFDASTAR